jgi:hypothetical protein
VWIGITAVSAFVIAVSGWVCCGQSMFLRSGVASYGMFVCGMVLACATPARQYSATRTASSNNER